MQSMPTNPMPFGPNPATHKRPISLAPSPTQQKNAPDPAPRYRLFFALYLSFIAGTTACYGLLNVRIRSSWSVGDWLINYSAGFVRRGLPGEFALRLGHGLGLSPIYVILFLQLSLYAVVFYCVWKLLAHSNWNLWVVTILLSPATLAFQVLDPPAGFRKEILLFAGLGTLLVLLLHKPWRDGWLILCASVFGVVCALSHEPLVLFTPYLFAALAIGFQSIPRAVKVGILPIVLTVATAALAAQHPGNLQMAQKMCSSLGNSDPNMPRSICNGAIAYIGRDQAFARAEVRNYIQTYRYYSLYTVLTVLAGIPILMASRKLWSHRSLHRDLFLLAALTLVSVAASTPLFLYGGDWGRWIYIHVFCIFLLLLFLDARRQLDPATAEPVPTPSTSRPKRIAIALFLFSYATCWDLPHMGLFKPRTGYFGLARYFYEYRGQHPSQPAIVHIG